MNFRKLLSLTLLISLVPLTLTSVVLYIVPEGRVAYWSDWKMLGLTKPQWGDIHINLGWLFLVAGLLHLYLNWKAVVSYMKSRARKLMVYTTEFYVSLILTCFCIVGTLSGVPPLSTILDFGESFKDAAAIKYGEPPYGHAELSSLETLARRTGLDLEKVKQELTRAKVTFAGNQETILEVARNNNLTPKAVWMIAKNAQYTPKIGEAEPFPEEPYPGFGKLKLTDICKKYGFDMGLVKHAFKEKNIAVDETLSLQEIAANNNTTPQSLFEILHEVANAKNRQ